MKKKSSSHTVAIKIKKLAKILPVNMYKQPVRMKLK